MSIFCSPIILSSNSFFVTYFVQKFLILLNIDYSDVKLFYRWVIIACSHTATVAVFGYIDKKMLHCAYNIKVFTCHYFHVLLLNHTGSTKVMEIKQSLPPLKPSVPFGVNMKKFHVKFSSFYTIFSNVVMQLVMLQHKLKWLHQCT